MSKETSILILNIISLIAAAVALGAALYTLKVGRDIDEWLDN